MIGGWEAPIRKIVENAGVEPALIVEKVRNAKSVKEGFDAQTETYVDMVKAGIIDPAKVTRAALENAASIAGLVLICEASVSETPEPTQDMPPMPTGGGIGGKGVM